jgi:hypothetical protein
VRQDVKSAGAGASGVAVFVEGAGQSGDAVEQNEDVFALFGQPFCAFDDESGEPDVAFDVVIKRRGDDFAFDKSSHFSDFFRAFVDEQHHEVDFGVIDADGVSNVLEEHCFAGSRRRYEQARLAFADGAEQIHDAHGERPGAGFESDLFEGINGGEVIEEANF